MATTATTLAQRGEKQAAKLGLEPGRLPPGQYITDRFPVLTAGPNPPYELGSWRFKVWGEVERPLTLDWEELLAEEQAEVTTDIHCVTRWSKLDTVWVGVRPRVLLERAGVLPSGTHVLTHSDGRYTANLPLEALYDDDVLLAHTYDGRPLEPDHGAPLRLIVPKRYFWKSAKFLRQLEITPENRQGFWERNGYHDEGDPWTEQRHWF